MKLAFETSRTEGLDFLYAYPDVSCPNGPPCPADADAWLALLEEDGGEFLSSDQYINREITPDMFTYESFCMDVGHTELTASFDRARDTMDYERAVNAFLDQKKADKCAAEQAIFDMLSMELSALNAVLNPTLNDILKANYDIENATPEDSTSGVIGSVPDLTTYIANQRALFEAAVGDNSWTVQDNDPLSSITATLPMYPGTYGTLTGAPIPGGCDATHYTEWKRLADLMAQELAFTGDREFAAWATAKQVTLRAALDDYL